MALTLSYEQVLQHAAEACEILYSVDDDSFAPSNAVRGLHDYADLTPDDCEAINASLNKSLGLSL